MVAGAHKRLDVTKKDVFVRNVDVTDAGTSGFLTTESLTAPVHAINANEVQDSTRIMNFNRATASGAFQQAICITDAATSPDAWGEAEWTGREAGAPGVPNRQVFCRVNVTKIKNGTVLENGISPTDTSLRIFSTSVFRCPGKVRIGSEIIAYTSWTAFQLYGLTRGADGTEPAAHAAFTKVAFWVDESDYVKMTFAHEAGHLLNMGHMQKPDGAPDGVGKNIMSVPQCPGAWLGNGLWNTFTGTQSALQGWFRVRE
jgi:hypothetical protein